MIIICRDCISGEIVQEEFEYLDFDARCEICKRRTPYCCRALEQKGYRKKLIEEPKHPEVGVKLVLDGHEEFIRNITAVEKKLKKIQKQIESAFINVEQIENIFRKQVTINVRLTNTGIDETDFANKVSLIVTKALKG